jgi:hypothetical protein
MSSGECVQGANVADLTLQKLLHGYGAKSSKLSQRWL